MPEIFLSSAGAGLCAALLLLISKDVMHSLAAKTFMVLVLGALMYLVHDWVPMEYKEHSYLIQSAAPACFWFSCRLIFREGNDLPGPLVLVAVLSFTLPVLKLFTTQVMGIQSSFIHLIGREIPQLFEYLLVVLGVYEVIRGWDSDLVESRRRLRLGVMGAAGLSLGWSVFSFNLQFGSAASRFAAIDFSLLIIIWFLFKSRPEIWSSQRSPAVSDPVSVNRVSATDEKTNEVIEATHTSENEEPEWTEELQKVQQLMQSGFYRRENLTLKDLSTELGIPEYRVRAVINKELGYRNFNEYLNEYRINEAAERLRSEPETPVSNIALDAGYRTLSSFNRAFRKEKETTPTAYREQLCE